ncbi:MAG: hypothetical protein E5X74_33050 [Mesorhizobium sp.]|uniref:hypothetical protein n=1 Tax=Mesorhizobium sp. TaxID=1871066 RepID=UPI00120CAF58|nr:hypothetical protein [Mesorhizobium sp.]TIO72181.1 MAG: hypothetical protein E5X75_33510 [Mesorhizobium sp.]TIO80389.1 MAG: hypothetical protein E5X74_33050 [Mesorhizobium sp.]
MTTSMKAKIVNVKVERHATGMFVATSQELKGLLVAKHSMDDLYKAIPQAIMEMYAVCGEDVLVTPAENGSDFYQPWIAIPAEVAKRALEHA